MKSSANFGYRSDITQMDLFAPVTKDVHTRHCCSIHGCKYGDDDCTVFHMGALQEHECEVCSETRWRKNKA